MNKSLLLAAVCLAGSAFAQAPGRFGFDCDGNWWDTDDRAGSAVSLHIIANSGKADRLVFYGFNNHFPESRGWWDREMVRSTVDGPWAHGALINCRGTGGRSTAIARLRAELSASTADNPYWHGMQGPPDIFYEAHRGVSASALQYVTLCSHSSRYNEQTGGIHSWDDIRFVRKVRIPNGNQRLNTKNNWQPWNGWMHQFDRLRLEAVGRADCSDATVAGYIVHGVRQTSISNLKVWIGR
jgi:hypothetical protein